MTLPQRLLEAIALRDTCEREASPEIAQRVRTWLSGQHAEVSVLDRARAYVSRMPAAISGQGGHDATWRVAVACRRGFSLSEVDTVTVLGEYNARCAPPWSSRELEHKARDASSALVDEGFLLAGKPPPPAAWGKKVAPPKLDDRRILHDLADAWTLGLDEYGTPCARIDGRTMRMVSAAEKLALDFSSQWRKAPSPHDVKALIDVLCMRARAAGPIDPSGPATGLCGMSWAGCSDIIAAATEPTVWAVDQIIPQGSVTMIVGRPGGGKSWVAFDLACASTMAEPWLGYQTTHGSAFILDMESGLTTVAKRYTALCTARGVEPYAIGIRSMPPWNMTSAQFEDRMMEIAEYDPGCNKLVVIDTLTAFSPGIDENSSQIAEGLNILRRVAKRTGQLTVVVVHHARKSADGAAIDSIKGNAAIAGAVDQALLVTSSDDGSSRTIRSIKAQVGDSIPLSELTIERVMYGSGTRVTRGQPVESAEPVSRKRRVSA